MNDNSNASPLVILVSLLCQTENTLLLKYTCDEDSDVRASVLTLVDMVAI